MLGSTSSPFVPTYSLTVVALMAWKRPASLRGSGKNPCCIWYWWMLQQRTPSSASSRGGTVEHLLFLVMSGLKGGGGWLPICRKCPSSYRGRQSLKVLE